MASFFDKLKNRYSQRSIPQADEAAWDRYLAFEAAQEKKKKRRFFFLMWGVAAAFLILLGTKFLFSKSELDNSLMAIESEKARNINETDGAKNKELSEADGYTETAIITKIDGQTNNSNKDNDSSRKTSNSGQSIDPSSSVAAIQKAMPNDSSTIYKNVFGDEKHIAIKNNEVPKEQIKQIISANVLDQIPPDSINLDVASKDNRPTEQKITLRQNNDSELYPLPNLDFPVFVLPERDVAFELSSPSLVESKERKRNNLILGASYGIFLPIGGDIIEQGESRNLDFLIKKPLSKKIHLRAQLDLASYEVVFGKIDAARGIESIMTPNDQVMFSKVEVEYAKVTGMIGIDYFLGGKKLKPYLGASYGMTKILDKLFEYEFLGDDNGSGDDDIYISAPASDLALIPNIIQFRGGVSWHAHQHWTLSAESQFNHQVRSSNNEQLPELVSVQVGLQYLF